MSGLDGAGIGAACSFCGAGPAQVERLISGPGVWICDGCVRASYEIIESLDQKQPAGVGEAGPAPRGDANPAVPVDDPIMSTIAQVQQDALRGHREQAAAAYELLWTRVEHGRPLHRISVAHYLADLQDDPLDELQWDQRALEAAAEVDPLDPDAAAVAPLRASLHTNTARVLYRLGRLDDAHHQLEAARTAVEILPEDGYGRLVRSQIDALGAELSGQQTLS